MANNQSCISDGISEFYYKRAELGENNIVWVYDEDYQAIFADLFLISVESTEFGLKLNIEIIKEYCKKYDLDVIDAIKIIKPMINRYSEIKQQNNN